MPQTDPRPPRPDTAQSPLPRLLFGLVVTSLVMLAVVTTLALARAPSPGQELADGVISARSDFLGADRGGHPSPPFRLRDQRGRITTLGQLRGRPAVLTFLFSSCEDTCPILARQIAGALDRLDDPIPAIAISVDPEGDTPSSAQRFLNRMRLGDRMRFLLGDRSRLAPIWKAYGIQPQGQDFDHSAYVVLLDQEGRQQVSFPADKVTDDGLLHDIRVLQERAAERGS
ncbi:SCO family protein [Patulibacter brassicae]|jgi:protein SCO1/2|uniref:SCO family protein n=1 Tax=Patulibacter brassicae TaxID=1705717 RepID=A0ABU4VNE4_9ACTN|nr:SCO family protein [Patulibacter brassicae]MDX8153385.1 SCO family protein [Patulibacter brassicae]